MIALGGGVSRAGETLLAPLRRMTEYYTMPVHRSHIRLELARHPDQAVLLGAVALARELV
jgi:glucokinase